MEAILSFGGARDQRAKPRAAPTDGSALKLPPKVEDTIAKLLPSEDVLDRPEFDAREFINRNFPDEQSLSDIGSFVSRLRVRMKELDDSLSQASQEQSLAARQALADLKEAKMAVKQLHHKIQDIRGKAEHSEVMVQEICRDIKQLDYAKRHLQTTLTALKRLHMLVNAVDQLELVSSQRNYKEAASLMEAVNQLFTHFDGYDKVDKIVELHQAVRALQEELSAQIFADFAAIGPLDNLEEDFPSAEERNAVYSNLSSACAVIDALGKPARDKLMQSFCEEQLSVYEKLFGTGGECAGLKNADQRYPWFYHLLSVIDERMDQVFPKHWRMSRRMCIKFCEISRSHYLTQVGALNPEEIDVTLLLKALQRTLMFERDVADRFEGSSTSGGNNEDEFDENGQIIDPHSAEGIKRRHRRKKRDAEHKAMEAEMEKRGELFAHEDEILPSLRGIISKTFDPFMTSYVSLERRNMEQMISEAMSQEIVDRNGQLPVFSSSVNMFAYIRSSVKRCLTLTNGQTFFNLHVEFRRCFQSYSQRLLAKLPNQVLNPSGSDAQYGSSRTKLSEKQEEELCFVINTAEYCAETLPSLEEVIRGKIDQAFSDSIELSQEIDTFHDVGAAAMKCIVGGLEAVLEEELGALHKMNWQTWEAVGDESLYVTHIGEKLRMFVPILRQMLSNLYFTNFYDKFAASFVPKILQAVLKCRRVNQVATQQMLLDVYALKTLFLQLPVIDQESHGLSASSVNSSPLIPSRYTKFVTQEMAKVENVLKLIGTPNDMLVESFKIMWPEGTADDFLSILLVKGVRKSDQAAFLDSLGMQRRPTGKMAEMEGKMTDMTESLRKNMQNFAKVPFTFSTNSNS